MQLDARRPTTAGQNSAKRRHPRHFLSAPVSTWRLLDSGPRVTHGLTLEVSVGGLSAVLCGPPQVGDRVSVRLNLPNFAFETLAVVRHSSAARTGFEFVAPSPALVHGIETCIQDSRTRSSSQPYDLSQA